MFRLDKLVAVGQHGRVYSLKPPFHNRFVAKIVDSGNPESSVYARIQNQFSPTQKRMFCHCPLQQQRRSDTILILSRCRPLPATMSFEELYRCSMDVLDILGTLHDHAILHNDVHFLNIMRKPSGRYVLLDYGMASLVRSEDRPSITDSLYYRHREDHFMYLQALLKKIKPDLSFDAIEFRGLRHSAHRFFQRKPQEWSRFRSRFLGLFDKGTRAKASSFLRRLCRTRDSLLREESASDLEKIRTKIFLSRFRLLFYVEFRCNQRCRHLLMRVLDRMAFSD